MDYINIPLNVQLSPDDSRDFTVSKLIAQVNVFPTEFFIPYNHEMKNQEKVSSCVGHSLAYCREITEEKQNNKYLKFSVGFIYGFRGIEDYQGIGMVPRQALKELQDYGNVLYDDFPYNEEYPGIRAKIDSQKEILLKKAEPYKISSYCRVYTVDEIKNALMQIGAVTVSYPIYSSFYNTGNNGIVPIPKTSKEKLYGNHMLTIIGWTVINNIEYWVVLNSWGANWGKNGQCFIKTTIEFDEAWSITDNILPHPEVEPERQKYYRVQMGAFKSQDNCKNYQQKILSETGFKSYIVFIDDLYKLQMNAFSIKDNAIKFSQQLKEKSYNNFIVYY